MKDPNELKRELAATIDEAEWQWLKPHGERDALIIVAQEVDLLEVGFLLATDEVQTVNTLIQDRRLSKPTRKQIALWDKHPETPFKCLIVQPYVLLQEVTLH